MGWLKKSLLASLAAVLGACAAQSGGRLPEAAAVAPAPEAIRSALERGDLEPLIRAGRARLAQGDASNGALLVGALDAFTTGDFARAGELQSRMPAGDPLATYLGAFVAAAQGDATGAIFQIEDARRLPQEQRDRTLALLQEVAGEPQAALATIARLERDLPPPPGRDSDADVTLQTITARLQAWRTAELLYRRGLIEHRAGDYAAAAQSFERVLDYAPNDLETLAALAAVRAKAPPVREPTTARLALSRLLMELADSSGAADFIVASIAQNPGLLEQLRLEEVLRLFALRLDPRALDLRLMVASDLAGRGEHAAELQILAAERNWGPLQRAVAARKAEALRQLDRPADALAALRAAVAAPQPLELQEAFALADVLSRLDQFDEALALLDPQRLPMSSAHDRADLYTLRGSVLRRAGRFEAAIAELRQAVAAIDRRDTKAFLAAVLSEFPATWAEGVGLHRRLLLEREDASSLNALAWGLLQNPEQGLEEAHRLVVRSVAIAPNNFPAIDTLGWSFYLHGDFLAARREIARALDLAGDNAPAELHDHLGDIYWRLDRRDDARAAWRAALKASPDALQRPALEAKLRDGLLAPAPEPKEPPKVADPLAPPPPKTDI